MCGGWERGKFFLKNSCVLEMGVTNIRETRVLIECGTMHNFKDNIHLSSTLLEHSIILNVRDHTNQVHVETWMF